MRKRSAASTVLAVSHRCRWQAVQGRQRVFPWIQSVRDQISDMTLPSGNLVKADMEVGDERPQGCGEGRKEGRESSFTRGAFGVQGCRIFQVDLSGLNGWLGIDASVGWQVRDEVDALSCMMSRRSKGLGRQKCEARAPFALRAPLCRAST